MRQEILNMRTNRHNKVELEKIKSEGLDLFLRDIYLGSDFHKKLNLGMVKGTDGGYMQTYPNGQSFGQGGS